MSDHADSLLVELLDNVPDWWPASDPASEVGILLAANAASLDGLVDQAEQLALNTRLATAGHDALIAEWAWLYGVDHEQLPPTVDALRGYLQELSADDGSLAAFIRILTALIETPVNVAGTELVFDAGGGGLTFPADGSGLLLFQAVTVVAALEFPAGGGGITFPRGGVDFPGDGSGLSPPMTFPSIVNVTFGTNGWFDVTQNFQGRRFTVTTKSFLAFDRAAVLRAIDRFRPAELLAPLYVETNT